MAELNSDAPTDLDLAIEELAPELAAAMERVWSALREVLDLQAIVDGITLTGQLPSNLDSMLSAVLREQLSSELEEQWTQAADRGARQIVESVETPEDGASEFAIAVAALIAASAVDRMLELSSFFVETQIAAFEVVTGSVSRADMLVTLQASIGLTRQGANGLISSRRSLLQTDLTPEQIAADARAWADANRQARNDLIGGNETATAFNRGASDAVDTAVTERLMNPPSKRWFTRQDELTCRICKPLHDTTVEARERFESLGYSALRPPIHINCRCAMKFILN